MISAGPPDPETNRLIRLDIDSLLPYATGTAFSSDFFVVPGQPPETLADFFGEAAKLGGGGWPVQWDTVDGVRTVKVTVLGGWYFWFDPSAGYALRKFVAVTPDGNFHKEMDVTQLVEAAKGIWFPLRATYVGPVDGVGRGIRLIYQAEKIAVNNPTLDSSVFTVPIPLHCKLSDTISDESFVVQKPSQVDDLINKDMALLNTKGQ
jgi:hypothetical protein